MTFGYTKKRSAPTTSRRSEYKRKECEHGMACPFRHEYQHSLEFSHSAQPVRVPPSSSNSSRVGGSGVHNRGDAAPINPVFSGGGIRLRNRDGTLDQRTARPDRSKLLDRLEQEERQLKQRNSFLPVGSEVDTSVTRTAWSPSRGVVCDLCKRRISLDAFDSHLREHELSQTPTQAVVEPIFPLHRRSNTEDRAIRRAQDEEYENDMLRDIQRLSEEEHNEFVAQQQEQQKYEQEMLAASRREALRTKQLNEQQMAILRLRPEPSSDCGEAVVAIRFRLPSGEKAVRRFHVDDTVHDIFTFLKTIDSLVHFKYELKTMVGNRTLNEKTESTLLEAGLTSNTSLAVVLLDIDDDAMDEILSPTERVGEVTSPVLKRLKHSDDSESLVRNLQSISFPSSHCQGNSMSSSTIQSRKRPRDFDVIDLT